MRTLRIFFLLLIPVLLTAQESDRPLHHPSHIIIKFRDDSPVLRAVSGILPSSRDRRILAKTSPATTQAAAFLNRHNLTALSALKHRAADADAPSGVARIFLAEAADGHSLRATIEALNRDENIEYAEPDYYGEGAGHRSILASGENGVQVEITPDDPQFPLQWSLVNEGLPVGGVQGIVGADINIREAWGITTGDPDIIVAILDTGIPPETPEFEGRLVPGYDFVNDDNDPTDDNGHGSNVASIALARGNNNHVMAGVNWQSKIMPLKILNADNWGLYSDWISAVIFAADSGARVVNMSVGGLGNSIALWDAINYAKSKGTYTIASMMNTNSETPYFPAAFEHVIAVGATNNRDERAAPFCWGQNSGSNFGKHIDFTAPGELILGLRHDFPALVSYWCGTSQATPLVSGVVSLLLSVSDTLSFEDIYDTLKRSARDRIGPAHEDSVGWDPYFGWGKIDAATALNALVVGINEKQTPFPESFTLEQNYPNPFNPGTSIRYSLSRTSRVTLRIFDLLGREVATLVNSLQPGNAYQISWQPSEALPSGIYFYQLEAVPVDGSAPFTATRRMLLMR